MALTTITANILDSQGNPLTGNITVVLTSAVSDGSTLYVPVIKTIPLVSGAATFTLDATDTFKIPYSFTVNSLDGSGNVTQVLTFQAVVPTSATAVNFSDLAKAVGLTQNNQDISLTSLSRLVYNSDDFWAKLKATIFVPKGAWSSTAYYKLGDIVSYNGSSYLCTSSTNIIGDIPPSSNWQLVASVGQTGTGTGGNNAPYDATAWLNQLDAPSRGAVRNLVQTLATQSQLATYAPLVSPALVTPTATTPAQSDNSNAVATTSYVKQYAAPISNPVFTGNPALSTLPVSSDSSNKIPSTSWVQQLIAAYAPLANAVLTGNPTAPTQAISDHSNKLATTQFVYNMFSTSYANGQLTVVLYPVAVTMKFGTTVLTTDSNGQATITFATPFTSTINCVIVSNGDVSAYPTSPQLFSNNLTSFVIRVYQTGTLTPANGVTYRVNWLAVGN